MKKLSLFLAIFFIALAGNITAQTYYGIVIAGVEVTSANCNNITGANISGSVSYNDESKTLTLDNATIDGYIGFGGGVEDITITLVGENTITGYIGTVSDTKTINGTGSLKVLYIACGTEQNTIIEDCTIEIIATNRVWAMYSSGEGSKLTIKNANISIDAGTVAIGDFADIELIGCKIVEPVNAQIIDTDYNGDAGKYVCDADGNIAKKVVIKKVANYGIEIAGVEVTSDNCDNITGVDIEGKVSYNPTTNTLTLDNATIKGYIGTSDMVSDMAFTINLQGENYMTDPSGSVIGFREETLDLIITSSNDGTLNVHDKTYLYVAHAKSFTIKDCSINIENSDPYDHTDYGIVGMNDLTPLIIDNANIEVTTKAAPAIADWKSITLTNVEVIEPQNYQIGDFYSWQSCILNEDGTAATHVVIKKKDSGIEKIANNTNEINIYPNPATNEIVINNIANNEIVEIFDITGKLVKKVVYNNKINVSDLLAGVYTIKVNNQIQKLVIE